MSVSYFFLFSIVNILIGRVLAIDRSPWCKEMDKFVNCLQDGFKIALVNLHLDSTTESNFIVDTSNYPLETFLKDASEQFKYMDTFIRPSNYESLMRAKVEMADYGFDWLVLSADVVKATPSAENVEINFLDLRAVVEKLPANISIGFGLTETTAPTKDPYDPYSLAHLELYSKNATLKGRRLMLTLDAVHSSWTAEKTLLMYLDKFDVIVFQSRFDDTDPLGNTNVKALREMIIKLSNKTLYLALDDELYKELDVENYGSTASHLFSSLLLNTFYGLLFVHLL